MFRGKPAAFPYPSLIRVVMSKTRYNSPLLFLSLLLLLLLITATYAVLHPSTPCSHCSCDCLKSAAIFMQQACFISYYYNTNSLTTARRALSMADKRPLSQHVLGNSASSASTQRDTKDAHNIISGILVALCCCVTACLCAYGYLLCFPPCCYTSVCICKKHILLQTATKWLEYSLSFL